jgi:murein DD-endopeptidase MepM/ murein hydrolase activator NlpD
MAGYPKTHLSTALLLALALVVAMSAVPDSDNEQMAEQIPVSLSIKPSKPEIAPEPAPAVQVRSEQPWKSFKIRSGDSLASIFDKAGLSPRELHEVISLGPDTAVLGKIMPGQSIKIRKTDSGKLQDLAYEVNRLKTLHVVNRDGQLNSEWELLEPEVILNYKTATITADNPSLYQAGKDAGLSDNLIMKLSYIFQWDISFALDLRQGDSFTVLFEDVYVEGEKISQGDILAAEFSNYGKNYKAVRYVDDSGRRDYFTPEGRSLRKAFLRDPVHFSHVSSSFNLRRLHPIHKRVMPHRGIDYAARRGTPVVAAGDGKVTMARQNNASGRYVVIQHGQQYTTKYLHLNGFAKGIRAGTSVRQGQTIGYVGDSGWATAPHLHYEFLVDDVHRNPRTVKLPKADPIHASNLPVFKRTTAPLLAQLESITGKRGFASVGGSSLDGE